MCSPQQGRRDYQTQEEAGPLLSFYSTRETAGSSSEALITDH